MPHGIPEQLEELRAELTALTQEFNEFVIEFPTHTHAYYISAIDLEHEFVKMESHGTETYYIGA